MNTLFPLKSLIMSVIFLGLSTLNTFAYKEFAITPEKQSCIGTNGNGTCWAAVSYMVLHAYGYTTNQFAIINWAVNNTCSGNIVANACSGNNLYSTCTAVDMVLNNFGPIGCAPYYGSLSQSDLILEIDQGRPIIAHWLYSNYGHDILIIGYTGAGGSGANAVVGNVIYIDPLYEPSLGRRTMPYASFVQTGVTFKWDVGLRLVSNPKTPIPTPVGGSNFVSINTGGTTVITPTTSSLTYSALSCCTSITWNWNLVLMDINGAVVVASAIKPTDNNYKTTWNITNFTLPAGHQWYYNYIGKIPGRVECKATIGSEKVYDAKDVVFVPSNLYPGSVTFTNQTVSSSHSDVKVHNSIQIINDQITSTGVINFKAGQNVYILPETKILAGSKVNITIDPSLQ